MIAYRVWLSKRNVNKLGVKQTVSVRAPIYSCRPVKWHAHAIAYCSRYRD